MSTRARSLRSDAVVAVSAASRAVGELAGLLSGLPDSAVWARWLRRAALGGDGLDVAVRCALGDVALLDAVPLQASTTLAARLGAVTDAARWAAGAVRSADGVHRWHLALSERERLGRYAVPLLALLAEHGELTIPFVVERLGTSPTTAGLLVERLAALGVVEEITGRRRDRVFRYAPVTAVFARPDAAAAERRVGENGGTAGGRWRRRLGRRL